jgi:cysteine desulfurase/selenocysteine lyase
LNLDEVRNQIPLLSNNVYLDNAGAGPPPVGVHGAMKSFLDEWRDYGEKWDEWLIKIVKTRELFGKLIGARVDEVANVPNVTSGLAAIANALNLKPKNNVVVSELNFPTNVYLWHALKRRGQISEARVLKATNGEIPLSDYEKAIDDNTVAVSLDYVSWINGCREDIQNITKIAHAHGALMLVDAFHALGVFPVDVRRLDVDVLTCGTYKWLMGPHGTAFLYVKHEIMNELQPAIVGWHGISDSVVSRAVSGQDTFGRPFDLTNVDVARDATRFEWGTWAVIAVAGAKAALEFTLKYPPEERAPLIEETTGHLIDALRRLGKRVTSPTQKERRSGIVTVEVEHAGRVAKKLQEQHIIVAPRINTLRISPHFYNTNGEIDKLLQKI